MATIVAHLDVYSHAVVFSRLMPEMKRALMEYCHRLTQFESGYDIRTRTYYNIPKRVFAASTNDRREFRVHKHCLDDILMFLGDKGIYESNFTRSDHGATAGVPATSFKMAEWFTPRDYQVGIIEYMLAPGHTKVTTLQTGKGKTAIALAAATQLAVRTILVVPAKYIYKWTGDVTEGAMVMPKDKVMVIKGSKNLKTALMLGEAGEITEDFIILSAQTLHRYIKTYEEGNLEDEGYICPPIDMFATMGIGLRIIDEAHENFHLNFKQDLYGHVWKSIKLSATLEPDDKFLRQMIEIAYPTPMRYRGLDYDKYIAVKALFYRINNVQTLPHTRRKMYSQVRFEESILKQKRRTQAYCEMVLDIIKTEFVPGHEPGQRMLVFADTVNMCTVLTQFIAPLLPELKVARYVGEDPDEILYTSDVVISTLKSAGTAVDIDGLKVALMTSALGSRQLNAQALGRLRKLKNWPDVTPRFLYLVCEDIPQHIKYHDRKVSSFANKVLSHKTLYTSYTV